MDRQAVMVRNALGAIRKGGLAKIGIFGPPPPRRSGIVRMSFSPVRRPEKN